MAYDSEIMRGVTLDIDAIVKHLNEIDRQSSGGPLPPRPPAEDGARFGGGSPDLDRAFELIVLAKTLLPLQKLERHLLFARNARAITFTGFIGMIAAIFGQAINGFGAVIQDKTDVDTLISSLSLQANVIAPALAAGFCASFVDESYTETRWKKADRQFLEGAKTDFVDTNALHSGFNTSSGSMIFPDKKDRHNFAAPHMTERYIVKRGRRIARKVKFDFETMKPAPGFYRTRDLLEKSARSQMPLVPRFW